MKRLVIFCLLAFTNAFGQAPGTWTVNPASYNYSMQVTCKLTHSCVELANTNNVVAAFINGQCRGVVNTNVTVGATKVALLVIYSNVIAGEKVSFQAYDAALNNTFLAIDSLIFSNGNQTGGLTTPFSVTDNRPPTNIMLSSIVFLESLPVGAFIANLSAMDYPMPSGFTYTLPAGQFDNAKFAISGSVLNTNFIFDYETDSVDTIKIDVVDDNLCAFSKQFVMHVNDKNDTPTVITYVPKIIYDHNPSGTNAGKFITTDPDPYDSHTYSLVNGLSSADNASFFISNDSIYLNNEVSYAAKRHYEFRIRTTDVGGLFLEDTFSIDVINLNDAPDSLLIAKDTISENLDSHTYITTMRSVDIDPGDSHRYSLVSGAEDADNGSFIISNDSLFSAATFDFELKNELKIRLQTMDDSSATLQVNYIIKVIDRNDSPTAISLSANTIPEQSVVGTFVGNFSTTDQDKGDVHIYTLVSGIGSTDNARFSITGNKLLSAEVFLFTSQTYEIRVRTTDKLGAFIEKLFYIKVTNINDAPHDIVIDTLSIMEDNPANMYVSLIRTLDIDLNDTLFTYTLVDGDSAQDNRYFSIENNRLIFIPRSNYDAKTTYTFRVHSVDLGGLTVEKSFVLAINDIDGNNIPLPSTNFISPNGDGKNDFWKVQDVEMYSTFALDIFDQFGQLIFGMPSNYNNDWDGTYKGTALPTGNYYYVFKNKRKTYVGNITIVNEK